MGCLDSMVIQGKYSASFVGDFAKYNPAASPQTLTALLPAERREECQGFQNKKVGAFLFLKKQNQMDSK
jgi:hypothetical protein